LFRANSRFKILNVLIYCNDVLSRLINFNCYDHYLQATVATTDTSCESVVTSGQHHQQQNPTPQHPPRDANNPAG